MHGSPEVGRLPSHLAPALLSACDVHFMGDRLPIQVPGGSAKQQGPARNHQQRVSQPEELVSLHTHEDSVLSSAEWNLCAKGLSELQMAIGLSRWDQLQGSDTTNV